MEEGTENNHRDEIFSKAVRAGKRTYFFDVKTTRGNDLYLTITESKKRYNKDGRFYYEKHKLFLYKEDFEKFSDGLTEAIDKIQELKDSGEFETKEVYYDKPSNESSAAPATDNAPEVSAESTAPEAEAEAEAESKAPTASDNQFTDVSFDDLGSGDETKEAIGSD